MNTYSFKKRNKIMPLTYSYENINIIIHQWKNDNLSNKDFYNIIYNLNDDNLPVKHHKNFIKLYMEDEDFINHLINNNEVLKEAYEIKRLKFNLYHIYLKCLIIYFYS